MSHVSDWAQCPQQLPTKVSALDLVLDLAARKAGSPTASTPQPRTGRWRAVAGPLSSMRSHRSSKTAVGTTSQDARSYVLCGGRVVTGNPQLDREAKTRVCVCGGVSPGLCTVDVPSFRWSSLCSVFRALKLCE